MVGHGSKFGRKKEVAIVALLTQRNIAGAAHAAGIGANTLLRWLKLPEFQKSYREARRAAFGQAMARLQQMSGAAVATRAKTMVEPTAPPSTRIRAAEVIINHAAKAIEIEDIEAGFQNWSARPAFRNREGVGPARDHLSSLYATNRGPGLETPALSPEHRAPRHTAYASYNRREVFHLVVHLGDEPVLALLCVA